MAFANSSYSDIITTTIESRTGELQDNWTNNNALLRKLRAMRKSLPKRDQLLLRIGAAKKEAGRAFGFVKIRLPRTGDAVTR